MEEYLLLFWCDGYSGGGLETGGLGGEPHESAFAELSHTEVGEEPMRTWYGFLQCLYNTF